jgi:hypothetical protein
MLNTPTVHLTQHLVTPDPHLSALQIDVLSEIVETVQGRIEVYLDGGIRTGSESTFNRKTFAIAHKTQKIFCFLFYS